jgi:predicted DNA-binding mobile mystery protein A
MNVQNTILQQYQRFVDQASLSSADLILPPEGWLRTMRKALGMSGAQLARKMGVSRALISQTENNEVSGSVTMKTMQTMAEAMGCRFVYAVLPPKGKETEDVILAQAMKWARRAVEHANTHMALENQSVPKGPSGDQLQRLARQLASEMAPGFWNDK